MSRSCPLMFAGRGERLQADTLRMTSAESDWSRKAMRIRTSPLYGDMAGYLAGLARNTSIALLLSPFEPREKGEIDNRQPFPMARLLWPRCTPWRRNSCCPT